MAKSWWGRTVAVVVSVVMVVGLAPVPRAEALVPARSAQLTAQATVSVANPRVVADSSMEAGQKATWDCLWFGSYPQEVVSDAPTIAALNAASWSGNRATVGGATYQRLYRSDAINIGYFSGFSSYYGSGSCLYFKCQPIKWRVLEADGSTALVLADQALDNQRYNSSSTGVTWETCSLRSWLNSDFMSAAFTSAERGAIQRQTLENADNPYHGTEGGNATSDDVFLLSDADVAGPSALAHGFAADSYYTTRSYSDHDEGRCAHVSDFAHAMGGERYTYIDCQPDNGWWWLRSPGSKTSYASYVRSGGSIGRFGYYVNVSDVVRPALRISLSSNQIFYAGTVCSDGTYDEAGNISEATVTLSQTSYTYDGTVKKPDVTVQIGNAKLVKGRDYTIRYSDNKNAGTAYAIASGMGDYVGTASATFKIAKAANAITMKTDAVVKTGNVKSAQTFTRTGKASGGTVKYASSSKYVTVTSKGKVTVKKNFTGTATVTASCSGNANYKAAAAKKYTVKVKPGKMALKKALSVKGGKLKATWDKMAGADKYQVRVALDSKFTKGKKTYDATSGLASKTTGKLTRGKAYYVQVRAYDKQTKSWGAWSAAKKAKVAK